MWQKVQGTAGIVMMLCIALVLTGCWEQLAMSILAEGAVEAAKELGSQKENTRTAFNQAGVARDELYDEVVKTREFNLKNPKIKAFVDKWLFAEEEVAKLEAAFHNSIKQGDFLFAFAEEKLRAIDKESLRIRAVPIIDKRKADYTRAAIKTKAAIEALKTTISEGKDAVLLLEIIDGMGQVEVVIAELEMLENQAIQKLPEIDALVKEAMSLLESEITKL